MGDRDLPCFFPRVLLTWTFWSAVAVPLVEQSTYDPKFVGLNLAAAGTKGQCYENTVKVLFILDLKCHGKLPFYSNFNTRGQCYITFTVVIKCHLTVIK